MKLLPVDTVSETNEKCSSSENTHGYCKVNETGIWTCIIVFFLCKAKCKGICIMRKWERRAKCAGTDNYMLLVIIIFANSTINFTEKRIYTTGSSNYCVRRAWLLYKYEAE